MWIPSPTQLAIGELQEQRKLAEVDLHRARSTADWLHNPRNTKRYRGKPDRLALERDLAAAHVARKEQRLSELDAKLAQLVAVANSE